MIALRNKKYFIIDDKICNTYSSTNLNKVYIDQFKRRLKLFTSKSLGMLQIQYLLGNNGFIKIALREHQLITDTYNLS